MKEIALIIVPFFSVLSSVFVLMFCLTRKKSLIFVINSFAIMTVASGIINISLILNGYFELNDKIKIFQSFFYLPLIILLFKEMLFQRIFAFFMLMTVISFLRLLGIALANLFIPYGENITFLMLIIITFVLYCIYIILVLKFGRKLFKKVFAYGHAKEWILYLLSAAVSWFILEYLPPLFQSNLIMALAVMFFVMWSFIILLFAIINTHERMKQKYEANFARDVIATGRDHYHKMNEQYDALRIMKHDYKFHLNTALDMLQSGDLEKSKEYLSGLHEQIENKELPNFCGNVVVNSLVSDYARKCKELNIEFNVTILIPPGFSVPNYEMCIVLGNLLENAVEACRKLENNRQIKLVLKPNGEQLILMVRNTFNGELVLDGEKFVSTKKDDSGGIGLESVMAVVDRFGEMFNINYDNEYFSVFVLWK
jgi:signal transduction histidine kinase